ncbi:hypothetical protein ETU09_06205 [Apibacter muscae]|uniref:Uncharacterized protein n=1 Tax=Apibacter muscae TaxID=2509004 RepID=A0A563DDE2_9FLAO|nr:hypothetical protein [Apibacter muscae]TWP28328.1 hypothetical protein ETU09_06205 [Apibacter muscae]
MGINTSNIYRFETIVEDTEYGTAEKKWIREVEIFLTGGRRRNRSLPGFVLFYRFSIPRKHS